MTLSRKILLLLIFTAAIIAIGRLASNIRPSGWTKGAKAPAGVHLREDRKEAKDSIRSGLDEEAADTGLVWKEKLFQPLLASNGLGAQSLRKSKGYWEIVLPKGKPIHEYALGIERICSRNQIRVVKGIELAPRGQLVEYYLEIQGSFLILRARLGKSFLAGSSKLAVIITNLDSCTQTQLAALEESPWRKTLMVDPYSSNRSLRKLQFTEGHNEILLQISMEPYHYPYINPGKKALFIHHSREEVAERLEEAREIFPKAAGYASKFGDRAVENLPLLDKLFAFTFAEDLVFLDLTGSQRSLSAQAAGKWGAKCRVGTHFRDSTELETELNRKLISAQKTGEALIILPYSSLAMIRLNAIYADSRSERIAEGLEFVTLSELVK